MSFKVVIVAVLLVFAARAHAGGSAAYSTFTAPLDYGSVGSTHESTVKGHGGNSVVSHYSKAVDTPYSSVRKFDTRISNDAAIAYGGAYRYGAAPAVYGSYAAPAAYRTYAAPAAYSAYAAPAAYRAYAAPAAYRAYAAPAAAAYSAYAAPAAAAYRAYAAPAAYGYPAYPAVAKAAVAAPLGVAYSAAPAVAHLSFSGLGATYGW